MERQRFRPRMIKKIKTAEQKEILSLFTDNSYNSTWTALRLFFKKTDKKYIPSFRSTDKEYFSFFCDKSRIQCFVEVIIDANEIQFRYIDNRFCRLTENRFTGRVKQQEKIYKDYWELRIKMTFWTAKCGFEYEVHLQAFRSFSDYTKLKTAWEICGEVRLEQWMMSFKLGKNQGYIWYLHLLEEVF